MYCYIEDYGDKRFPLVSGSVYTENFNETLDSFNIIITNETENIQFKKFQYFKVCSDVTDFETTLILDNFTKRMLNLNGTIYYEYSVNLMSETKLLEKWLVPNRQILHSLVNKSKTIGEVIREMCELYIPRVKKDTNNDGWEYQYAIQFLPFKDYMHPNLDSFAAFDAPCPDLQFGKTNLREVLTTLSQVVGYLPIIKNRRLLWLNLREKPKTFNITENKVLNIQKSNSSDSFITTLRTPLRSTLDNKNVVRNEVITFRDSENVFLKQQENLVLTTDFPIEKINSLKIYPLQNSSFSVRADYPARFENIGNTGKWRLFLDPEHIDADIVDTSAIDFYMLDMPLVPSSSRLLYFNAQTPKYVGSKTINAGDTWVDITDMIGKFSFFVCRLEVLTQDHERKTRIINSLNTNDSFAPCGFVFSKRLTPLDLTPIVVERSYRNQLNNNYANVPEAELSSSGIDLSPLAENYYTTIEFSYQGNQIRGFSNHWDWFEWYGKQEATLIDVLSKIVGEEQENYHYYNDDIGNFNHDINLYVNSSEFKQKFFLDQVEGLEITQNTFDKPHLYVVNSGSFVNYATCVFDIEYVPFNDITIDTNKAEDLPIEYENFDMQESSITMLDEFSARELEKVKRLGNDVLQVQQLMTVDFDNIQPLNSLLDDNIIFSRSIEFYENIDANGNGTARYNVSYVASKDYVLKNFFTALQNKYRAFEYVDASESVFRQELHKSYVMLDFDRLILGSDKFSSDDFTILASPLISDFKPLKYAIVGEASNSKEITTSYKYDLSIVSSDNYLVLSHSEPYPNHYGIRIDRAATFNNALGGFIQRWIPHSDSYKTHHRLGYSSKDIEWSILQSDFDTDSLPEYPLPYNDYYRNFKLYLKDNTPNDNNAAHNVSYYSNIGERLSDCSQFIYYSANEDIYIDNEFVEENRLSFNDGSEVVVILKEENTFVNGYADSSDIKVTTPPEIMSFEGGCEVIYSFDSSYNNIPTEDYYAFISLKKEIDGVIKYKNLISVKLKNHLSLDKLWLCFSLNDTKTLNVYSANSTSGIWELTKEVKKESADRLAFSK